MFDFNQQLIERHQDLIKEIIATDYYSELLQPIVESYAYQPLTPVMINEFWNDFWYALPDSSVIHGPTFNKVCDLCDPGILEDLPEYA